MNSWVEKTLAAVGRTHRLMLITKGDLVHQLRKVRTSGLEHHFEHIEVLLEKQPPQKLLEVGTGCGYQAAVLAQVFPEVYSIERIKGLLERARRNLVSLRLANLRLVHGDGYAGLERAAPFHSIIVAAAAPRVPEALQRQLAPGGRMVLPVHAGTAQRLVLVERNGRGFAESRLHAVRFVPMEVGKA